MEHLRDGAVVSRAQVRRDWRRDAQSGNFRLTEAAPRRRRAVSAYRSWCRIPYGSTRLSHADVTRARRSRSLRSYVP